MELLAENRVFSITCKWETLVRPAAVHPRRAWGSGPWRSPGYSVTVQRSELPQIARTPSHVSKLRVVPEVGELLLPRVVLGCLLGCRLHAS